MKFTVTTENQKDIINYIVKSISEEKADNVVAGDNYVTYKGSTSKRRGLLFGNVDGGIFNLDYKDGSWWLNYQINVLNFFIFAVIFSIIVTIAVLSDSTSWWKGIVVFSLVCVANLFVNSVRHEALITNIVAAIDELIIGKAIKPKQDKMTGEPKSWF